MGQIGLPLSAGPGSGAVRIVLGSANRAAADALASPQSWPFRTAILAGPPRSGKSLLARWFVEQGRGDAIDDADRMDETALFHRWNRAQEEGVPLLLIARSGGWQVGLPDLASRLGAALHLEITQPGDDMAAALLETHATQRGLALGEGAVAYLTPRMERSFAGIERVVAAVDRLSLERKQPVTLSICRDALASIMGPEQPRLL
jgi:chromosomal replication initiation ATPase DnaA